MGWSCSVLDDQYRKPRAWKLATDAAQLYEVPEFLTKEQCNHVIKLINQLLVPSEVTFGSNTYRTSRTCHLPDVDAEFSLALDHYIAELLGVDPDYAEPIQGQRYDVGQYFKAHHDWFDPTGAEYEENCALGGQRTWTVMIYLNTVLVGGETDFPLIGRKFVPTPGLALAWNNLHSDGTPNQATYHEALPVEKGCKYVITKWFRMEKGRC